MLINSYNVIAQVKPCQVKKRLVSPDLESENQDRVMYLDSVSRAGVYFKMAHGSGLRAHGSGERHINKPLSFESHN